MREILFRAKRIDNGEWVEGNYVYLRQKDKHLIHTGNISLMEFIDVDPKTIGQFTGLTDKNGVKIFEGDIVEWRGINTNGVVVWSYSEWECFYGDELSENSMLFSGWHDDMCVIGNIHDNSELLNK